MPIGSSDRRGDRHPDALPDVRRLAGARAPQDDHELLAAVARRRVLGADGGGDRPGDGAQHHVAGGVPVAVVEALEVVDVDHQDAGAVTAATPGRRIASSSSK